MFFVSRSINRQVSISEALSGWGWHSSFTLLLRQVKNRFPIVARPSQAHWRPPGCSGMPCHLLVNKPGRRLWSGPAASTCYFPTSLSPPPPPSSHTSHRHSAGGQQTHLQAGLTVGRASCLRLTLPNSPPFPSEGRVISQRFIRDLLGIYEHRRAYIHGQQLFSLISLLSFDDPYPTQTIWWQLHHLLVTHTLHHHQNIIYDIKTPIPCFLHYFHVICEDPPPS